MRLKFAKKTRRVTDIEAGYRDVLGNNGACADDDMIANRNREDGCVCPDTYMITKFRCSPQLPFRRRPSANKRIIDEHGAVRNEAFVSDGYELTDECVRLDTAAFANVCPCLYLNKGSDEAIISDRAPIKIDRLHHCDVFTEGYIDNPCLLQPGLDHRTRQWRMVTNKSRGTALASRRVRRERAPSQ